MTDEFIKLLRKETLYIIDYDSDIIIKSVPNDGYYMNLNLKESKTSWESYVVFRAVNGRRRSSKYQYLTVGIHVAER